MGPRQRFRSTGLDSNCTGGIRSRGRWQTAGDQITHQLAATKMEVSANSLTVTAEKTAELSTVVASAAGAASTNVKSVAMSSEDMPAQ
jgi:hypothetical protein